jgi:hypothetical protein
VWRHSTETRQAPFRLLTRVTRFVLVMAGIRLVVNLWTAGRYDKLSQTEAGFLTLVSVALEACGLAVLVFQVLSVLAVSRLQRRTHLALLAKTLY